MSEWADFLSGLSGDERHSVIAGHLSALWNALLLKAPSLWPPQVAGPEDETHEHLIVTWDKGGHHIDFDVYAAGYYEWFYKDRSQPSAPALGGEDLTLAEVVEQAGPCLHLFEG